MDTYITLPFLLFKKTAEHLWRCYQSVENQDGGHYSDWERKQFLIDFFFILLLLMFHGVPECSRVERYSGALTRSSLPVCYCVPVCFSVPLFQHFTFNPSNISLAEVVWTSLSTLTISKWLRDIFLSADEHRNVTPMNAPVNKSSVVKEMASILLNLNITQH